MKRYEAMFILKPDLDKTGLDKALAQIQEVIAKNKGVGEDTKEWGKHKLAFPIKKYKEGVYYIVNFSVVTDAISAIKKSLCLNESILRMLITAL
ncbi:MAG: 30S ribosomal protein S6 [Candidatus Omnitrophota bacterium]